MITRELDPQWHPCTAHIPNADPAETAELVRSFLTRNGDLLVDAVEPRLAIRYLSVCSFTAPFPQNQERYSGWVVGGNCPYMEFNGEGITEPFEALIMYAMFVTPWVQLTHRPNPNYDCPEYWVAPNWEPLTYDPGFKESCISLIGGFITWNLLPFHWHEVVNPEIRRRVLEKGWMRPDGTSPCDPPSKPPK